MSKSTVFRVITTAVIVNLFCLIYWRKKIFTDSKRKATVVLLIFVVALCFSAVATLSTFMPRFLKGEMRIRSHGSTSDLVGLPMIPFTLHDLNGQMVSSDEYRGKVVLLDFWATWCRPCCAGLPGIDSLNKKYTDAGLAILTINLDDPADGVKLFMKKNRYSFPVLFSTAEIEDAYHINFIPSRILIDKKGIIREADGIEHTQTNQSIEDRIISLLKE